MTSILGTAEILQNGLVKPEDVPHFAGNIHRETERLIGLVNDIIKLSRLDEGGGLGQWETVDLYEEARAVLEQLAPAAQRKQVTTRLQGGEALVRGVPQIVEEIVYNLCDNAIAYNRANGSVTVTVENTAFGPGSRWRTPASAFPGRPRAGYSSGFTGWTRATPKPSEAPVWDCPLSSTGRPSTGPTSPWRASRTAGPPSASPSPAKT